MTELQSPLASLPAIFGSLPPEIQLGIQLERIFMPQAWKQRLEYHGEVPGVGARFVHYTSADNALNIIRTKRLWLRNTLCMSDFREVQHGFEILQRFFGVPEKKEAFKAALEPSAPGVADEAITLFDQWFNATRLHTFIASVSEHLTEEDANGRLSMWRAFGNSAAPRVAIVIRVPQFSGGAARLNLMFSPVAYLTEGETHDVINTVIRNITATRDYLKSLDRDIVLTAAFNMLVAGVVCLKHEGFAEEREWRAIYSPARLASNLIEESIENVAGVPQMVFKVPLDAAKSPDLAGIDLHTMLDRIIIGPSPYPDVMWSAFVKTLHDVGIGSPDKKVFASRIPLRT